MMRFVGIAANCEIVFLESPHFDAHRKASNSLNNGANRQAFIVTLRPIVPGEELRWKYNHSQTHRLQPCPPSPFSPLPADATPTVLSRAAAFPRAAATVALPQRRIFDHHDENPSAKLLRAAAPSALPQTAATSAQSQKRPSAPATSKASAANHSHDLNNAGISKSKTTSKQSKQTDDGLDPDCICHNGDRKCKMNHCWFQNGRTIDTKRRSANSANTCRGIR